MRTDYALQYKHLYENHWWWLARQHLILRWLRRTKPPEGFGPILDVGCGDGLFFERLAEFGDPEGVESDPALVTDRKTRWGLIHVGRFEDFSTDKRYGLILSLDVIEHVVDDGAFLKKAISLLATTGTLIATVPAFGCLWTRHDELNRHQRRYTKRSFGRLARQAGLEIITWHYCFHWVFLAKLTIRLKEWLLSSPPRIPEVPPNWLNKSLYWASRLEQLTVGQLPLPFGSSLVVLARNR